MPAITPVITDATAPCHECCSGNDNPCVELLGCPPATYPWDAMQFPVAGVIDNPDYSSCCQFSPPGFATCFNRTWSLSYTSTDPPLGVSGVIGCPVFYEFHCTAGVSETSVRTWVWIQDSATVRVRVQFSGVMTQSEVNCSAFATYDYSVATASFDCEGPWTLALNESLPFSEHNWPATLTVTAIPSGEAMDTSACCASAYVGSSGCIPGGVLGGGTDDPTDPTKVIVGCCPGSISKQLSMAIFKTGATCDCLESSDVPLVWTNAHKAWVGAQYACGGVAMWAIWCAGTSFDIGYYWNGTLLFALSSTPGDWECDPFTMDVASLSMVSGMGVPCPSGSTLHLIITDPTPV